MANEQRKPGQCPLKPMTYMHPDSNVPEYVDADYCVGRACEWWCRHSNPERSCCVVIEIARALSDGNRDQ